MNQTRRFLLRQSAGKCRQEFGNIMDHGTWAGGSMRSAPTLDFLLLLLPPCFIQSFQICREEFPGFGIFFRAHLFLLPFDQAKGRQTHQLVGIVEASVKDFTGPSVHMAGHQPVIFRRHILFPGFFFLIFHVFSPLLQVYQLQAEKRSPGKRHFGTTGPERAGRRPAPTAFRSHVPVHLVT